MKLLFDQNISFRVIKSLPTAFNKSVQVREIGLENKSDIEIWRYAKHHHFAIVTFDADFINLQNFKGSPPKIILLKLEDQKTDRIISILKRKEVEIV